ncbi:pectinesterase/pectinesterase inhibitor [Salix suchowensis]|nr:pectinesterase/pectinesterase inhibitor [Salix suchowensis]
MDYGRLGRTESDQREGSGNSSSINQPKQATSQVSPTRKKKIIFLTVLSVVLIAASAASATILLGVRAKASGQTDSLTHRKPTQAISKTCSKTRFPSLCVSSLLDFPGSMTLYQSSGISFVNMETRERSAFDDCLELLEDSIDALSRSLSTFAPSSGGGGSTEDVVTWLSAALTNQDTCSEGFEGRLKDLTELVSNCLAIFSASIGGDFSGVPIQNKRRLMTEDGDMPDQEENFPSWLGSRERRLLGLPVSALQADIIVSGDGSGTCKTISEAIKKAPEHSNRRTIIYVKAGSWEEEVEFDVHWGREGKDIISGGKSVFSHLTTFHTASFAATGAGFIARDMTFENWAGPAKHQAVALRVGADHAVVYRCDIMGYQDTLYVHSNRQFFRECNIYGTVDFIFGNAAVVLQNCSIYARKPMASQKNTITAQNRKDPNQNTGISIHACRILAGSDLAPSKGSFPTYLGRPWKLYSRTVYMLSYMGDHIHPRGWLEWDATFALDTLYYGEYMNSGPGAAVGQRVKWPGYRVITSTVEASKFTVAQFIYGSSWLPSTGVAFLAGLSV